jgi:polyhydroxybutyrate depolymerase
MKTLLTRILTAAATLTLLQCFAVLQCAAAESKVVTWTVEGVQRKGIVFAPAANGSAKLPLVFAFHGRGDSMENFAEGTAIHTAWPQAIIVYMQGLPVSRVNAGGLPGWQVERGQDGDRDLKLFDQALAWAHQNYRVDDSRVYSTGFSNGANFTYLLWAERAQTFAAFAPVAGRLAPSLVLKVAKPLLHIAGEHDDTVAFKSQKEAMQIARAVDGVSKKGTSCGANCTLYASEKGTPVMTVIHQGGHEYPDGTSETIVKFFKGQTLSKNGT